MNRNVIDLSLPYYHEMPVHPDDPRIGFINFAKNSTHGCNMTQLVLSSHGGTHMDAPSHFIEDGRSIDQVDLNTCIGPALVINLENLAAQRDLIISDLEPYQHKIKAGTAILLRTDWYKMFPKTTFYTDFFGISVELAVWLANTGISLIGVETPAIHPKNYERVHKVFLSNNIAIIECLANLDSIHSDEIFFVALPLKLKGLDGSPVRAVAIEDR